MCLTCTDTVSDAISNVFSDVFSDAVISLSYIKNEKPVTIAITGSMVGVERFELSTPWPPVKYANQAALHPDGEVYVNTKLYVPQT